MRIDQLLKEKLPTPAQMHALIRFVDAGSLADAFGHEKSAQAAATQQLGRIDACLGILTRKSVGTRKIPSEDAKVLAGHCREFLQHLDDYKAASGKKPNTFVIGAGDSLTFYLLMPALRLSGAWKNGVELHLRNLRSREIVQHLLDGTLDIGLVRPDAIQEAQTRKRIITQLVCKLDYSIFVRRELLAAYAGDPTDERALFGWCAGNLPLAIFWGERSLFTTALEKTNLAWSAALRCASFPQVKEAVAEGGYCGILPSIAFGRTPPAHIVDFGGDLLTTTKREVSLAYSSTFTTRRPGGEIALRELRDALAQHCAR